MQVPVMIVYEEILYITRPQNLQIQLLCMKMSRFREK